jgi:A/G-specific adenine glycosylase
MELGATVCLPRQPVCLLCPVVDFCVTRGERPTLKPESRQKKREIRYTLDCKNDAVFLVQRAPDASLMPGMWELPETIATANSKPHLTLRHSITVTDYTVRVHKSEATEECAGQWVASSRLKTIPLTGLARKILRAADIL